MHRKLNALTIYTILEFASSLLFSLIFTVNMIYHVKTVGLSPLQLVLVGTILEATVFIFEIPTGVLADVKSRRLSVIIGYALTGLAFVVEGSLPFFWSIALAQVCWGLGFTFTSGATQAWIADELGAEDAGFAFLRGAQAGQIGSLAAIPISIALGSIAIALPIVTGGGLFVLLAAFLALAMPEEGFTPSPAGDRTTSAMMRKTVRDARQLTRRHPILRALLVIGLFYGLYSEGFDRLWTAHVLENAMLPWLQSADPVVWMGIVRGLGLVVCLAATEVTRRRVDITRPAILGRVLMLNAGLIVVALASFGLARTFWLGIILYWLIGVLRSIHRPLYDAWYNQRIDDPQVRATMFSVTSQVDAIGQVGGGPVVGAIGNAVSIRAALVASALLLSPVLPLYSLAIRRIDRTQAR